MIIGHKSVAQLAEDGNAEQATSLAAACLRTINPGIPGHALLAQLAQPSNNATNKERDLAAAIASLGLGLNVELRYVKVLLEDGSYGDHPIIPIENLATEIFQCFPKKLLIGLQWNKLSEVKGHLQRFWRIFRKLAPDHPIYTDALDTECCIPIKLHMDEGTGLRKAAVLQITWGPVLVSEDASWSRYFFWSCMGQEQYKHHNMGYEIGNAVLDSLMQHLTVELRALYYNGLSFYGQRFRFVCVGLEGDLPAQAKAFHLFRNWQCSPNMLCPWCSADDGLCPAMDYNSDARWRDTISVSRPWVDESPSPLIGIPGAATEQFLQKDLFHICSLGIARTMVSSLLCYLIHIGHFQVPDSNSGQSVPVRFQQAYRCFKQYCHDVLRETPHIKHFSRENFQWASTHKMPESTMKASDCRLMLRWLVSYLHGPWQFSKTLQHAFLAAASIMASKWMVVVWQCSCIVCCGKNIIDLYYIVAAEA